MPTLRQSAVASITRMYPLYSGGGRLANLPLLHRVAGASDEIGWARVQRGGYLAAAPLGDYDGRSIFYFGEDRKISWVCSRLIQPGDTVIDIGANMGSVSLVLSALVGKRGRVHSFEPNPQMQALIESSIARNGIENIRLHRMALGARAGELVLSIPRGHTGAASFIPARAMADHDQICVPVDTLSAALAGEDIDRIRLVKVDVEGFEPQVFEGGAEMFARTPPDVILFELLDLEGAISNHPSIKILSEYGYGFFCLPRRLFRMSAESIDPFDPHARLHGRDLVAARLPIYEQIAERLRARPPRRSG
jgi:FkbM family methyltransferase